jgi:hypothetical protein
MAPEQIADAPEQDAHLDVYSTGVMLYQMLAGRLPFGGNGPDAIFEQVLRAPVKQVTELCPGLDPTLASIVHRAMARDRLHRFHGAHAMQSVLREWLEQHGDRAAHGAKSAADHRPATGPRPRRAPRPRRHALAIGGGAAALTFAAVMGWSVTHRFHTVPRAIAPLQLAAAPAVSRHHAYVTNRTEFLFPRDMPAQAPIAPPAAAPTLLIVPQPRPRVARALPVRAASPHDASPHSTASEIPRLAQDRLDDSSATEAATTRPAAPGDSRHAATPEVTTEGVGLPANPY